MIITAACPANMLDDANALAAALAFSADDLATFRALNWQDAAGNLYAAASFEASPEWIAAAQTAFQRPAWDAESQVNLTGASRAQAAIVLWIADGETEPPLAALGKLTVVAGLDGRIALASMGLAAVATASI